MALYNTYDFSRNKEKRSKKMPDNVYLTPALRADIEKFRVAQKMEKLGPAARALIRMGLEAAKNVGVEAS